MPSNHLILCRPLLLLPSIFPSIKVFSNESALHIRWPKYWSCSFNISPSNEHPGQISFRMDWLDLLAVQGTLKSLLQHYNSKASILRHSAFFTVQLSYPYMTTGKTIALTRWTFVGKVTSLLLNMLSRLVITFLPRSKHLLISWLQSPSAVILEPKKFIQKTLSTYLVSSTDSSSRWYWQVWKTFPLFVNLTDLQGDKKKNYNALIYSSLIWVNTEQWKCRHAIPRHRVKEKGYIQAETWKICSTDMLDICV